MTVDVDTVSQTFDVVLVGGGAAGLAAASSILARRAGLRPAIVEPSDTHDYQPAGPWSAPACSTWQRPSARRPR